MPHDTCIRSSLLGLAILLLCGCSNGTDSGEVFVPRSGHVDNWSNFAFLGTEEFHGSLVSERTTNPPAGTSRVDLELCTECHGTDFDGGISRTSCFACHDGPDGVIRRPNHQPGWLADSEDIVHFHGRYANDFPTSCTSFCHGNDLTGGIGPSCFDCHDASEFAHILAEIARADTPP